MKRPFRSSRAILFAAGLSILLAGCAWMDRGDDDGPASDPTAAAPSSEPTGSSDRTGTATRSPQARPGSATMGDAEVLGVLASINRAEVEAGRLAADRATSPRIQQFARQMVDAHSTANERIEAAPTAPQPSDLSRRLEQQSRQAVDRLRQQQGDAFDRAYVENQTRMHRQALDTIERDLMPAARDPQVKQMLQSMRSDVASHLDEAQRLQNEIARGGMGDRPMPTPGSGT